MADDDVALVARLAARAAELGEAPPFSDQTLVDLRAGRASVLVAPESVGAAVVRADELEVFVDRAARGRGVGSALVLEALHTSAVRLAWAHGDNPAAAALAVRLGWTPVRTLLQLRTALPDAAEAPGGGEVPGGAAPGLQSVRPGWTLDGFRIGVDEADWLALNAAAFAHHPEQGGMTLADLQDRERDAWFDADDLLLLRDAHGRLAGSCWLKVEGDVGEFYAVAVRPDLQGQGVGGILMRAGFARLSGRGLAAAALYVEGDNLPALALYRRSGFSEYARDVQYASPVPG